MKHPLTGIAVAAALVVAAPVWAQNPSGGNSVGTLGPNPGGPPLTPYTGGAPGPAPANSAMPPSHHHYAYHHARAMHHFHKEMERKAALSGDTTAQLNREELARIQSGNFGGPEAAPPGPMPAPANPSGGNSVGLPGPNPGGPGLTPYTH